MEVEAILLTGGASRRMGSDKSKLLVGDEPAAVRLARELQAAFGQVTVLGREPLDGCAFLEDSGSFEGPLSALARFEPVADWVFVCSCDLPLVRAQEIAVLWGLREQGKALVPLIAGRLQPLCALYPSSSFDTFRQLLLSDNHSMMAALNLMPLIEVAEPVLEVAGIQPSVLVGANSPKEWTQLLAAAPYAPDPKAQARFPAADE